MKSIVWSMWTGAVLLLSATSLFAVENWKIPVAKTGEVRLQVRSSVPYSAADMVKTAKNPFPFEGFRGRNDRLVIESQLVKVNELAVICDISYMKTLKDSSDETSRELLAAIDQTVNAAKKRGIACLSLNCSKTETVLSELKQRKITRVVLMTGTNASGKVEIQTLTTCLKQSGIDVFLMRDFLPIIKTQNATSPWRGREQAAGAFERQGGMTVASTDLTGQPAFRFKADKRPKICFLV
ncbi:MAG: hypothetical protein Q4G59_07165, partial [Planctomycetia bacterium]|nr:hypothetical protein [Planctomycetia bacterium]